jgi:hypothetical protein
LELPVHLDAHVDNATTEKILRFVSPDHYNAELSHAEQQGFDSFLVCVQPGEADEQLIQSKKFKKGNTVTESSHSHMKNQPMPARYQLQAGKVITGAVLVSTRGRAIPITATASPPSSDSSRCVRSFFNSFQLTKTLLASVELTASYTFAVPRRKRRARILARRHKRLSIHHRVNFCLLHIRRWNLRCELSFKCPWVHVATWAAQKIISLEV